MTEAQRTEQGKQIIKLLGLRVKQNGRVDTEWGDKTPLGLALTLLRILSPQDS